MKDTLNDDGRVEKYSRQGWIAELNLYRLGLDHLIPSPPHVLVCLSLSLSYRCCLHSTLCASRTLSLSLIVGLCLSLFLWARECVSAWKAARD